MSLGTRIASMRGFHRMTQDVFRISATCATRAKSCGFMCDMCDKCELCGRFCPIWDALGTQNSPPPTWGEGLHLLFADYFHRHFPVVAQRALQNMETLAAKGPALVGQLAEPREAHGASLVPVRGVGQAPVYSHAVASGSRVPMTRPKLSSRGVMPPRSLTTYCAPVSGSVTT